MKTPDLLEELATLVLAEARQALLEEVRPCVDPAVFERLRRVLDGAGKLLELVGHQRISVGRLRHLLFGPKTEKGSAVGGGPLLAPKPPAPRPRRGHGRRSHRQYKGPGGGGSGIQNCGRVSPARVAGGGSSGPRSSRPPRCT